MASQPGSETCFLCSVLISIFVLEVCAFQVVIILMVVVKFSRFCALNVMDGEVCAFQVVIILMVVVKFSRFCALNVMDGVLHKSPVSFLLLLISITCCWIICGCPGWAMEPCWEAMTDWPGGTIMIPCVDMATLPGPTIL